MFLGHLPGQQPANVRIRIRTLYFQSGSFPNNAIRRAPATLIIALNASNGFNVSFQERCEVFASTIFPKYALVGLLVSLKRLQRLPAPLLGQLAMQIRFRYLSFPSTN